MTDWRIEVGARALYRTVNQRTKLIRRLPWEDIGEERKQEFRQEAAAVIEAVMAAEAHKP